MGTRARRVAADIVLVLVITAASIAAALLVTPMQSVSAAGQTVRVGATAPTWGLSGPGELDLFGQELPTSVEFAGPVRPRLELTRINLGEQLAQLVSSNDPATSLENALVRGWKRYFCWQVGVTAVAAVVLLGAAAGWRRRGVRDSLVFIGVGLLAAEAVNVGAIMSTALTASGKLSQVRSLESLVGSAPGAQALPAAAAPREGSIVVIGDSTAAGLGLQRVRNPSKVDNACERSADSYAANLAGVTHAEVTNLACSGATAADGLLGPQQIGDVTAPAQLSDPRLASAATVIVSIGANDVRWSAMLQVCAVSPSCTDAAQTAFFQQQLNDFARNYLTVINQLKTLPGQPQVIVNLYYDPFTGGVDCLSPVDVTPDKVRPLSQRLEVLNTVLASGADAASFTTAKPDYAGHGVCSDRPYVQGLDQPAPMHPTAAGQLAIALADSQAMSSSP